jgi:cell division protein FtsB
MASPDVSSCPSCDAPVPGGTSTCPSCGKALSTSVLEPVASADLAPRPAGAWSARAAAVARGRVLPWVLVAALFVAVLVLAISRGSLGSRLSSTRGQLSSAHAHISAQSARNDTLTAQVSHWETDAARWHRQSRYYQTQVHAIQGEIHQTLGDLSHPSFSLWNSCGAKGPKAGCRLDPGHEYIGGVPDTFTYRLKFRATVPVTVRIVSGEDFVCLQTDNCAWHGLSFEHRTKLDRLFHDAEGCAGYFAVFTSERGGTLYPDVWVTRHPALAPTGACA